MFDILLEAFVEFLDGFCLVTFRGKLRIKLESLHRTYYSRNTKDEGGRTYFMEYGVQEKQSLMKSLRLDDKWKGRKWI